MRRTLHGRFGRREFLKAGAAVASALLVGGCGSIPGGRKCGPRKKVGLQLYSVRKECAEDLPGVIEAVGKMGYDGVEFAGYYDRTAEQLRSLLDASRLACCGTHTALSTLLADELEKTIAFNKTLGNRYLIVPSLPRERRQSVAALKETAALFDELAAKVAPHDMVVGYHSHPEDFASIEGQVPWDILFGNTGPDVVMQLDTGNATAGGADPVTYIRRYAGRSRTIHIKEYSEKSPDALLGDGDLDWPGIFTALETVGGTEWYIVEYEREGRPALQSVRGCLESLRRLGYV